MRSNENHSCTREGGQKMSTQKRVTVEQNIKQDTASKKYYVTFYFGMGETGNRICKTKTFNSLGEARTALKAHELAVMKGDAVEPSRMSLNAAVKQHLETIDLFGNCPNLQNMIKYPTK